MASSDSDTGDPRPAAPGTLGDVLYANPHQPLVPEVQWVDLLRSIAAGEQAALHALYERAHRVVFTLALRITCNRESAEEVTLDVFFEIWRRAAGYDPASGSVLGWIMNQTRSRAIDRLRFERRRKRAEPAARRDADDASVAAPESATAPDPHDVLDLAQRTAALRDALALLAPGEREAIEAAFFGGLTHSQVAARLNQPLGTVKTRIRSGLHKLRQGLGAGGEGA